MLASGPRATIQDVFLQQAEERFHRGVVAAGRDPAHRSDHVLAGQSAEELPASKLGSSVAVNHTAGDISSHRDGVLQRVDGQA